MTPPEQPEQGQDPFSSAFQGSKAIRATWQKALDRKKADPASAITLARAAFESVCKQLLDEAGEKYSNGLPLPELFKLTVKRLNLAPSEATEPVFRDLFVACIEVVRGVGNLRNFLSDSHGHGTHLPDTDWHHAELAVNLAGTMAVYVTSLAHAQKPTVGDFIAQFLSEKPLGESHHLTLAKIRQSPLGEKTAAKLTPDDLVEYCKTRAAEGLAPSTIHQYMTYLRGVLKHYKLPDDSMRIALPLLRESGLVGKSQERLRRPLPEEMDKVLAYFRVNDKKKKARIPMTTLVEFAAASGRRIGEITALKWDDLDYQEHTCITNGKRFRLIGRAWDIVLEQKKKEQPEIFPYNSHSASALFTAATNALDFPELWLNDLRIEAICRLLTMRFSGPDIREITGQNDLDIIERIRKKYIDAPRR